MKGVFEKIPGSGVWHIRYADAIEELRTDPCRITRLKEQFENRPAELPIGELREWFAAQD